MPKAYLTGCRILVVEDEHMAAKSLIRLLEQRGATIVGPAPTVDQALVLLRATGRLDAAVIDINLRGEIAFGVADEAVARGVRLIFITGYGKSLIPERFRDVPVLHKPYDSDELLRVLRPLTG
jgi:CheY-like chemotaxis protein